MAEAATKTVIMNVSKEALWTVITDYENYPKLVTGLEACRIVSRKGNTVLAEYDLNMMKKFKYTLKHVEKPMSGLKWSMESGELFKSNDGFWDIKELKDGSLEVTYSVSVGLPLFFPKALLNTLVGSTLPKMLEDFEKMAKSVEKKSEKPKAKKKA